MFINLVIPHDAIKYDKHFLGEFNDGTILPVVTVGRDSYVVHMGLSTETPFNFHIGRGCMVAHLTNALINMGKNVNCAAIGIDAANPELNTPHKGQIIIQNDVWIGFGATIMSGVKIGNGAVIAANSHVIKDVPPYAIVGGNPAKVIKYRFTEEQIEELQKIAWWDWDNEKIEACKADFTIPISEFIEKHRVLSPPALRTKELNLTDPQLLFFPDFDEPMPLWREVIKGYCENPLGKLQVYFHGEEEFEKNQIDFSAAIEKYYSGKGEIIASVGDLEKEDELFAEADCFIPSRCLNTVRRSCLADRYGVKIISPIDTPFLHELKTKT